MTQKNYFLVFDGVDGSGHSTVLQKTAEYLKSESKEVILTKEPTEESDAGREARALLRSGEPYDPMKLQELFIQDRFSHVRKISTWLTEGKWVLCDRYRYSTIAYGAADGAAWGELVARNREFLPPRLAFIFDLPVEEAIKRLALRGTREERFEDAKVLEVVRQNYLRMIQSGIFPEMILIGASPSIYEITQAVLRYVNPLL